MKRIHWSLLASFIFAYVLIMVTSQPAAAASCLSAPNTTNCDGKDPVAQGCGQISTLDTIWSKELKIELRYSANCKTAWTRLTGPANGAIKGCVYRQEYAKQYCYTLESGDLYTDMVYVGDWYHAKACGRAFEYAPNACTGWLTP